MPSSETLKPTVENVRFHQRILTIAPERLIFLDESGVMVGMTRRRARCLGGRRVHEATPESHWRILTVIGAMSLKA